MRAGKQKIALLMCFAVHDQIIQFNFFLIFIIPCLELKIKFNDVVLAKHTHKEFEILVAWFEDEDGYTKVKYAQKM